jgi:hypothetical protein
MGSKILLLQTAVGQFTNSTLQDLYDTLIVQGSTSLKKRCAWAP